MTSVPLPGCTAETLMDYLKALAVLRLVSQHPDGDSEARGYWRDGQFVLQSTFDQDALRGFFLEKYAPTPILAPWGARSGFFDGGSEKSAREALDTIMGAEDVRLVPIKRGIREVRELLKRLGLDQKAEEEEKLRLLAACRAQLGDQVLCWLDACYVLTGAGRKFPPLLGTGGNEGSGSYVSGFAQQVVACLIERNHDLALDTALFGTPTQRAIGGQVPGHFSPGTLGGANASQGFSGQVTTNRWDYLLCIEGTCLWASSVARRCGQVGRSVAAFPFTVNVSGTGAGSLSSTDATKPKEAKRDVAEMWLPLWSRPASISEIIALLGEGRVTVGRRAAETGVDFARAAASLGIDRGVSEFSRVLFLMRNGQSFMGVSVGRITVSERADVDLLREIDPWLAAFRLAVSDKAPPRFRSALRQIDRSIFDFCQYGGAPFFQAILRALGRAEAELATGERFRVDGQTGRVRVRPLSGLSSDWISAAADGSPEFDVALALAGIFDDEDKIGSLRANLEPVDSQSGRLNWAERDRRVVWSSGNLIANLAAILARRLMDGARAGCADLPFDFVNSASPGAIAGLLAGTLDESRIEHLLWGLMLVDHRQRGTKVQSPVEYVEVDILPRQFALLKLMFLPFPLQLRGVSVRIRPEPAVVSLLGANRVGEACRIAMRRLRSSGLTPLPHRTSTGMVRDDVWSDGLPLDGRRLAAALLVPISWSAVPAVASLVMRTDDLDAVSA